jgi:hypothetical protein
VSHVALVLRAADAVATHSDGGDPVLVHCSDGWDRTAQVVALAQLLLDPYFRTIDGFAVLVEKDWCAFGHMFRERGGFGAHPEHEAGPIFAQFLDAVSQLLRQFPAAFEFTDDLLAFLADAASPPRPASAADERRTTRDDARRARARRYSRFYATFLRDTDRARRRDRDAGGADAPVSVWRVFRHARARFANVLFDADAAGRLRPRTALAGLAVGLAPLRPGSEAALLRARVAALEAAAAAAAAARDEFHTPPSSPRRAPPGDDVFTPS